MKKLVIIILSTCLSISVGFSQRIGVLMDSYVVERWMNDRYHICDQIKTLGGESIVEVANGNADVQVSQAKALIDDGVKVLIVVPVDIQKGLEIVDYAQEKGVSVIAYDRIIPSENTDLYLSFDNEMVGELQAKEALKHAGNGNYILINGPKSDYNAILFRKGQLKVLNPLVRKGEISIYKDIVLSNWSELDAFLEMQEVVMKLDNEIVAIIAANDALASGVISALSSNEVSEKIYITGQDAEIEAIRNLKEGSQDMTIYKPIKELAYLAAESAMKMANGKNIDQAKYSKIAGVEVKSILLKPMVVTVDNYMETVVADGHVTIDELAGEDN
ncbi:substrate-binding domain-containing protein [Marivirga arenosa]|uniref:Substrate-binding domain-containing protein n=1 Tax=Marivirga arenosa TaxID=3059076 RepID=A0AA49JI88_9BACT|nr:substrate-binding domain-containing protein [Marivirga sp. ABR2-2]WKK87499.2 substrate-binding domain-containing protein [Marivirga sp. ABR2-2]